MSRTRAVVNDQVGITGLRIGHATAPDGTTGVTAALFDPPASVVVEVRGGASCTFDTASLSVEATFGRRWALFFAGGSVYGLDAARGIRTSLLSSGAGQHRFRNPNRIVQVSGATLFDLPRTERSLTDYLPLGFEAAESASAGRLMLGNVGAGAGATVGKYLGRDRASRGGLGYRVARLPTLGGTGALAVLNSVGAVRHPLTGEWVAGPRDDRGNVIPPEGQRVGQPAQTEAMRGTNLVLVVTETALDRSGLHRVAVQAHDGLSRAVIPAHTATDGDVVFVATTARRAVRERERYPGATADRIGAVAADCVAEACVLAVRR
jgi:L-aminopeptidase/D-esterase-like protein